MKVRFTDMRMGLIGQNSGMGVGMSWLVGWFYWEEGNLVAFYTFSMFEFLMRGS